MQKTNLCASSENRMGPRTIQFTENALTQTDTHTIILLK